MDLFDTPITKLPENLSVDKDLDLDVQKITNIVYREHVGEDDIKLFSVFVNGEIQISIPEWDFLGNFELFETRIDKNLSEEEAKQYKQVAKECVDELIKIRKNN
ncbi:hypothetical protein [Gilliamella sp. Pas-s95]|uniref:hypothetical protein n=1 Tax=Gilliamella sp. Pas-s95 TaxID=2687317 RepID=UPI00132BA3DF|nr:hypothetical protein [Gilliamella sp. Pas-s95]MWN05597.1 hypothetical protein [Gilliamella sp. Pas-s95]